MHIVRSGAADKFDSLVSELGQNPVEIMAAVGLSAAQFRDPDTYLAYPRLAELLEEAAARCQQPFVWCVTRRAPKPAKFGRFADVGFSRRNGW